MSISSISNRNSYNLYSNNLYTKNSKNLYAKLSSAKRINKAADDAAGLAIAQKLKKHETGLTVGGQNAREGVGALNVADGAMGGITDYLQRMRELALRAENGLYSDSERQSIQTEIDGLKEGIQSLAKTTSLNEQKLMDGSMADMHLATNPNGGGLEIHMQNTTLDALGIAGFDVTGKYDLKSIDRALEMVSGARGSLGAATNRLDHTYNYNSLASEQTLRSRSKIEDLDMPKAISEKKKEDVLAEYRNLMLRRQMNQRAMMAGLFQ